MDCFIITIEDRHLQGRLWQANEGRGQMSVTTSRLSTQRSTAGNENGELV
jgi:hypothetical protein